MSEVTNKTDGLDIYDLYSPVEETETAQKVEEQVEEVAQVAEETAQKAEEVAKEVVAQVVAQAKAAPAKKALPAVRLVKLSRDDLKKKDAKLVEKHVPSRIKDKDIKWDSARSVVVILKSGKERAYHVGSGAAPALFESKKHADIVNYLKNM